MRAQINTSGAFIPKNIFSTQSLLESVNIDRWDIDPLTIKDNLGINTVTHCDPGTMPSKLAIEACQTALERSDIDRSDIDAVIYCGIEGDYTEPATAHIIQAGLGINAGICFDVKNACHGFTSGLQIANALITSGQANNVLVTTAEVSSWKVVLPLMEQLKAIKSKEKVLSLLGAFSLGDAGGAMILERAEGNKGILTMSGLTNSKHNKLCHYGTHDDGELFFEMDMRRICNQILRLAYQLSKEGNWTEFDKLITHQAGKKPYEKILDIMGAKPENSISTYQNMGNLASSTIAVNYDLMAANEDLTGQKLTIASAGSGLIASLVHIQL